MDKFKKNKQRWMEDFTQAVSRKMPLRQPLDPPDPSRPDISLFMSKTPNYMRQYTFESKPHERTLTPPELLLSFDPGLAAKILDKATRTRFAIQATLLADGPNTCIDRMQDLSPEEEEHLGSIQESKEAFCVGLSIVREDGYIKTQQRVEHEFRCLYERSGHQLRPEQQQGKISDIWRKLSRIIRVFILVEQREKRLKVGRLIYYPKADISLRKVKMNPCSFIHCLAIQKQQNLNFSDEILYGYVAISSTDNNIYKLVLLLPQQYQKCKVPLLGIFLFGRLGSKQDTLLWTLIMDYLITPLISKRISVKGDRTGLLIHFEQKAKQTNYLFQVSASARWTVASNVEQVPTFATEHRLSTREIIMEQQKEESQVESVQSRTQFPEFPHDTFSSRSNDEKDFQIAALKKQLQLQKNHCEKLKEIIKSLEHQIQIMQYHPPAYQMHYPPVQNIYIPAPQNQVPSFKEEPYFGQPPQPIQLSKVKEFKVKDKNFSFAQENSIDQDDHMQNILANSINDEPFQSPQFNDSFRPNLPSRQIKSFEERKQQKPTMVPNSMKKTISQPENNMIESPRNFSERYKVSYKQEEVIPESEKKKNITEEKKQINAIMSKYSGHSYNDQRKKQQKIETRPINKFQPSSPKSPRSDIKLKETREILRKEVKDEQRIETNISKIAKKHQASDSDSDQDDTIKQIMQKYKKKK